MRKLLIKQIKSVNRRDGKQQLYLKSLGLKKIGQIVERVDNPINRKLVHKLNHVVRIIGDVKI